MLDSAAGQVNVDSSGYWATASETYQIGVTVFPTDSSDGRQASGGASVTVYDPGATILITAVPPGPYNTWPDPFSTTAFAYEAWNPDAGITYQWFEGQPGGPPLQISESYTCSDVSKANLVYDGLVVVATDANGASRVQPFGIPAQSPPAEPTVSISETDPGGMVFEGDQASFDIHADYGTNTPILNDVPVFYTTVDGSGTSPTDYQSKNGPQEVVFKTGDFTQDQTTGVWSADKTFTIDTAGGIDGGGDKTFSVQLSDPLFGVLGGSGGDTATATVARPEVDITSPGTPSGEFDVSDDGSTRMEVDLHALIKPAYAALGTTSLTLALPQGASDLTFWDAATGGNQLTPTGVDNVLKTWTMPNSGTFDEDVWVSVDPAARFRPAYRSPSPRETR